MEKQWAVVGSEDYVGGKKLRNGGGTGLGTGSIAKTAADARKADAVESFD